jgi:hypothetical protein
LILSDNNYIPAKNMIIALSIGLKLNKNEIDSLLKKAGYSLDKSKRFDVIVSYFITRAIFNIHEINITLFYFELKTL